MLKKNSTLDLQNQTPFTNNNTKLYLINILQLTIGMIKKNSP